MNVAMRHPMTLDAFLDWERRQELRYEFDGMGPVAMNGETISHNVIAGNVLLFVDRQLRRPCKVFRGDLKIIVNGRVRYPDAAVSRTGSASNIDVLSAPVVVFEVLSPSTASTDRISKNEEHRATPSIQRYVMLEQDRIAATVFSRRDNAWLGQVLTGDDMLVMPEIGAEISLALLYTDVTFTPPDD